ncbi:hypothetical protein RhiirA4_512033 [Rhizophagus irregularis]|uniref:Uncharacterized protein n=1 Tax=Rhizophagus irregularis TaxID=588596 RepID=A0A2I1GBL7_9GLOM|nr:hypothetical protein RhiirA4_512033 [Rhizophagus irregularis]
MELYIYLFIISLVITPVEPLLPEPRYGHSSTLVGTKLYFFGGLGSGSENNSLSTQTFFLDVSKPFRIDNPPWTIVQSPIPVGISQAQSFAGGNSKDQIFLYGGERKNPTNFSLIYDNIIYLFDTRTQSWNIPPIGVVPSLRRKMQIPVDNNGEAYLFGGQDEYNVFKDMNIFDSINLRWSLNISANDFTTPRQRSDYTATLLKNGMIIYIGGWEINDKGLPDYVDMSQLSIFDTKQSLWGITQADGDQIGPRRGHQAALTSDEKIIIYGGVIDGGVNNETWVSASPVLAVLDTKKGKFRWSIPQTSKTSGKEPPPLIYSTSIVIGDYMIMTFGNITNSLTNPSETSSELYLLDTRNFTWVDTFEPPKPSSPSYTLIIIIVGSVAGFIILVIILTAFICFYKRKKKKNEKDDDDDNKTNDTSSAIITPGSDHFLSQNNNIQDNQNTQNSQNSAQFSFTNSINTINTSQTSSNRGSDGLDGMYYDRHSPQMAPQMAQMNKKVRRGSGQQYYQNYSNYSSNSGYDASSGRGSGSGGYNNNNVYNEFIGYNIPLQQRYSPNQPQIVQNDVYSGVVPQHGFIPQQGYYPHQDPISTEYDQPPVPFYHSSNANMNAASSYSPYINPSYSPTYNSSYFPPNPPNPPSHTPPFYNPSYTPPYNTSYSPSSHSPPFPFNNPSPTQLNINDSNRNSPHSNDSTNIPPGSDFNSSNRRDSSNPTISRSGSFVDRIRRIGSGRRNRNSSNTTTTTNNTTSSRSSYTRSGLINTRSNDYTYNYGDYRERR